MTTLLLLLFSIVIFSCSLKEKEITNSNEVVNIDLSWQLFIKNKQGENLLNKKSKNGFKHSDIKLYEDKLLHNEITDNILHEIDGVFFIELYAGGRNEKTTSNGKVKFGTLYLRLNNSITDTIYSESIYNGNSITLHKIIYNSSLVYKRGEDRKVEIIK